MNSPSLSHRATSIVFRASPQDLHSTRGILDICVLRHIAMEHQMQLLLLQVIFRAAPCAWQGCNEGHSNSLSAVSPKDMAKMRHGDRKHSLTQRMGHLRQ